MRVNRFDHGGNALLLSGSAIILAIFISYDRRLNPSGM
jgi:hypothetical protein